MMYFGTHEEQKEKETEACAKSKREWPTMGENLWKKKWATESGDERTLSRTCVPSN